MSNKTDLYVKQIEKELFIASLRFDGIIHVYFKPNTHITVELQKEMLSAYFELTDISRPFIFEGGEFVSLSKEARLNAIQIEPISPVGASAVIVKNLGQRIIADYYYRFNKPKKPLRVFKCFNEAATWLNSLKLVEANIPAPRWIPGTDMHNEQTSPPPAH